MNFSEKLGKKSLGFWFALASAVIALVSLIIYFVYTGKGGENSAWVILSIIVGIGGAVGLFFYEGEFSDYIAIASTVLFALALLISLQGGVGNIADSVEGIVMFGKKDLAPLNYTLAVTLGISTILSICSCFVKREKD